MNNASLRMCCEHFSKADTKTRNCLVHRVCAFFKCNKYMPLNHSISLGQNGPPKRQGK